ncbi:MAG: amidohydrolase family protein [Bacteroidota bacterium]
MKTSIFLKNVTFIDWKTLQFKSTHIKVEDGKKGKIQFIPVSEGIPDENELQADTVLDCTGKFVTKSFGCGHHHVYSALAAGMPPPKKKPGNFLEILKYVWWTLDKCLNKEMIEASALVTAIACVKNGVTFVIDHHSSPNCIEGSLEIIARAFDRVGVSHLLCYEISDRDGLDIADKGLKETEEYLQKHQGLVGLHASFTVGESTLKKAIALADKYNSGIHVHVAEDLYDQKHCMEEFGKRLIPRYYEAGALRFSKTILAHCIHLDVIEKQIVKMSNAYVVQNTESNLNNNVGNFDSRGLGENIMLGTDGMHSDMLRSAKAAFIAGQGIDDIDLQEAYRRFRNIHNYISNNGFDGDGENNLVVLDYDIPAELNHDNFSKHFIDCIESKHVRHVISSGKLIVKDRQVQTVNEAEILTSSKETATKLWERMKK